MHTQHAPCLLMILAGLSLSLLMACGEEAPQQTPPEYQAIIDEVKATYAPDKRVAIFEASLTKIDGQWTLEGETNLVEAREALLERLNEAKVPLRNYLTLLPTADVMEQPFAMVNNSVANLRSNPRHSAELATQALLGTPLKVWMQDEDGDFFRVQTPDGYIAWVDHGGIVRMDQAQWKAQEATPKVIYTQANGWVYTAPNREASPLADIVGGGLLALESESGAFFQVRFPDGRTGYLSKAEAQPYEDWLAEMNPSPEQLVNTSQHLLGLPYLWGGTSPKGVDCSGFTKTIYFLNGMVLPRDASQQVHSGTLVDDQKEWATLEPGDLLFFGTPATEEKGERVVHVGMWIGDGQYIHASGRVKVNSMDPEAPNYDAYNDNRYLRTKRLLGSGPQGFTDLTQTSLFAF